MSFRKCWVCCSYNISYLSSNLLCKHQSVAFGNTHVWHILLLCKPIDALIKYKYIKKLIESSIQGEAFTTKLHWWVRRHGSGHVAIVVFLRIHCWAQFNYAEHNNNIKWKQPHRSISNVIECLCGLCIAICDGHSPEHITESICIHGEWTLLCGVMGHTMIDNDRHITPNSIIAVYVCFGQILICNSGTVQHSATVIHTFLWYCTITVAAVK